MSKKAYIWTGVVIVVLAFVIVVVMQRKTATNTNISPADGLSGDQTPTGSSIDTFSGTISAVDTGCLADGVCSVTVDGKKVVLVQGGQAVPPGTLVGKLIGVGSLGDLAQKIGAFANVYAGKTANGDYSIYGNSDFYVEIVPIGDK